MLRTVSWSTTRSYRAVLRTLPRDRAHAQLRWLCALDRSFDVGPLIDSLASEPRRKWKASIVAAGSRVVCGSGSRVKAGALWFAPTILMVTHRATDPCWTTEVFGPVVTLSGFDRQRV